MTYEKMKTKNPGSCEVYEMRNGVGLKQNET